MALSGKKATKRKAANHRRAAKARRVVLFPTEPSIIGEEKIRDAIDRVIAMRIGGKTRP
jgi:hypothetical protein